LKNTEITIHLSVKRKNGTKGSTHTIHKDVAGTKWTSTLANGKTFKMSPEQLLSHLFKATLSGKAIIEVVPDSPEKAVQSRLMCSARYDDQGKLDIGY
jgi:hypothetical protein